MRFVCCLLGVVLSGGCGEKESAADPPEARPVIVSEAGRGGVEAVQQPSAAGITLDDVDKGFCIPLGPPGCPSEVTIQSPLPLKLEQAKQGVFTICHEADCLTGKLDDGGRFSAPSDEVEAALSGRVEVSTPGFIRGRVADYLEVHWRPGSSSKLVDGDRFRVSLKFPDGRQLRLVDTTVRYAISAGGGDRCGSWWCATAALDLRSEPPIDTLTEPRAHDEDAGLDDAGR